MKNTEHFSGVLQALIKAGISGNTRNVDFIMEHLTPASSLAMTRYVDYALSLVENEEGIDRIKYYLFKGSLMQRNYASLYLNRLGEWKPVKQACELGLIDEIQAYAR